MTGAALIQELRRGGVRLIADGDVLRFVGPRAALGPDVLRELAERKSWILGLLRAAAELPGIGLDEWADYAEERAAIREYDGGFPRAEAERLALEDVLAAVGGAS